MRHGISKRKLNRPTAHRISMFRTMACSLIEHERIKTTLPKAKDLRPIIEKLVTIAKPNTLHARKLVLSRLHNNVGAMKKLCDNIAQRCLSRNGGYTRILKSGFRYGDAAPMAIIEFVDKPLTSEAPNSNKSSDVSMSEGTNI